MSQITNKMLMSGGRVERVFMILRLKILAKLANKDFT